MKPRNPRGMISLSRILAILALLDAGGDVGARYHPYAMTLELIPQRYEFLFVLPIVWPFVAMIAAERIAGQHKLFGVLLGLVIGALPLYGMMAYLEGSLARVELSRRVTQEESTQVRKSSGIPFVEEESSNGTTVIYEKGEERRKTLVQAFTSLGIEARGS